MTLPCRAVLFDLDETLIDRDRSWRAFVARVGLRDGADAEAAHAAVVAADGGGRRAKEAVFAELAEVLPLRERLDGPALEARWRRDFPGCCVVRDGATRTLAALRAAGLRLAIVSNGRADMQGAKVAALGLGPLVDATIVSGAVGVAKPDARIFALALDAVGVRADEAIFVGDHPASDVVGPIAAGLRAAWLSLGRAWPAGLATTPTWTIAALDEVIALAGVGVT